MKEKDGIILVFLCVLNLGKKKQAIYAHLSSLAVCCIP